MNENTFAYFKLLLSVLENPSEDNSRDVLFEKLGAFVEFNAHDDISCASKNYIQHELEWYKSEDLNIIGHAGIESNKVWQQCATKDGKVNSNYGWCIFSKDNGSQYEHALNALLKDKMTKHGAMIYTRPSIHDEAFDGIHANYDMHCTIYVLVLIRNNKLDYFVHMRSNDIWNGMRNDLAWHQYVLNKLVDDVNSKSDYNITPGKIFWNADSLHLYKSSVMKAVQFMSSELLKLAK